MFKTLWNVVLYNPLYNLLILLVGLFGGNAGLGILALTLVVKAILLPFTAKTIKSQIAMKAIEPKLQKIREEHSTDKQLQTKKTFELYKEHKVNPFTGCLLLLVQLPVIIALYQVVLGGFDIRPELLYGGINFPENISTMFLGLDITKKSLILAILVAGLQFLQGWLAGKNMGPVAPTTGKSMQADLQKSMQMQMKYFLPVMVGFITYTLPAAIGLYWAANILVTIAQEYYLRNRYKKIYERSN